MRHHKLSFASFNFNKTHLTLDKIVSLWPLSVGVGSTLWIRSLPLSIAWQGPKGGFLFSMISVLEGFCFLFFLANLTQDRVMLEEEP